MYSNLKRITITICIEDNDGEKSYTNVDVDPRTFSFSMSRDVHLENDKFDYLSFGRPTKIVSSRIIHVDLSAKGTLINEDEAQKQGVKYATIQR